MYDIVEIDDYKIFKASKHAIDTLSDRNTKANSYNLHFIKNKGYIPPTMPITGAFIYAHPPNYSGVSTLHWQTKDWQQLFQKFNKSGIDTAIFQAAVWKELQECYYPSQTFKTFKTWNVIEPMLQAAEIENIKVFLGGYGSTTGLSDYEDKKTMEHEKKAYITCLTELMKYKDYFAGFYFTPETAFTGTYNKKKITELNKLYRDFFVHIKNTYPFLQILMSPGTKYFKNKEQEMFNFWAEILNEVPLDILSPQDSIGTCGNTLLNLEKMYSVWDMLCRELKITLWANVEIFQRGDDLSLLNHSFTASPERVAAQINIAAPFAEKLICWEAIYYLFNTENPRAKKLTHTIFNVSKETT